jgi:fibronectin-binding autotransporter adhesin
VFWARTEGNYTRSTTGGATYSDLNIGQWSMRTGFDGLLYQNGEGMLLGGLTAHYGLATADIRSLYGDGRINTTGQGFGATATWYGATGFYVDSQAQVTVFDSTLKSDLVGRDMAHDKGALGYAFSIETGKRFGLNGPWSLTPQAQLIYSAVQSDFTDNFGANVSLGNNERLTGRLGMALEHQRVWRDDAGKLTSANVYGVANVYYEFLGTTSVNVAGTTFGSEIGRTAAGFGFGGTYNWDNNKYALYGEALVKTSFDDNYSVGGTAGLRIRW